jgi:hypothetical protein
VLVLVAISAIVVFWFLPKWVVNVGLVVQLGITGLTIATWDCFVALLVEFCVLSSISASISVSIFGSSAGILLGSVFDDLL